MIDLMLCVNDEYGNTEKECRGIDIYIDGDLAMQIECQLSFLEIPDNVIQIDNQVMKWDSRGTMVGNVFWNSYGVMGADVVLLLNNLKDSQNINLNEAWQPLWDRWKSGLPFDMDLLNEQVATDAQHIPTSKYQVDDYEENEDDLLFIPEDDDYPNPEFQ